MESYNFKAIEKKWQDKWEETGAFHAETNSKKPKFYTMIEFPYPSGAGLHVGHPRSYTALDIIARKRRMEGYNVLYPIGWDSGYSYSFLSTDLHISRKCRLTGVPAVK